MFEKVSKYHPDKVADRIAGAIVDLAYAKVDNPKIAVEVLLGHGHCHIIAETSISLNVVDIEAIVRRIAGLNVLVDYKEVQQDQFLAKNQAIKLHCGDNGIFLGLPETIEEQNLVQLTTQLDEKFPTDGKYIIDNNDTTLIICQSNADDLQIEALLLDAGYANWTIKINPLGYWTGGTDVDTGATNRKLGSDMGRSATGGGLAGKDLSKADVSVNIYCWLKAQKEQKTVSAYCAIGDDAVNIDGEKIPFESIVSIAKDYINSLGGFEKFAEYGLLN